MIAGGDRPTLTHSISELFDDAWTLTSLQVELLRTDVQRARRRAVTALICGGSAALLGIAALMFGLVTAAYALVEEAGWRQWTAFLLITVVALLGGAALAWVAYSRASSLKESFDRSQDEFKENLNWLRRVVRSRPASRPEAGSYI